MNRGCARQRLGVRQSSAAVDTSGAAESASRRRFEAALWRAAKTGGLAQSETWRGFTAASRSWILLPSLLVFANSPLLAAGAKSADAATTPGLRVAIASRNGSAPNATDVVVLPNLSLYVPVGAAPTPSVSPGKFEAKWTGFVSVDLRSDFRFEAELNGEFKLEINGATVLEGTSTGDRLPPRQFVRLNKGANVISATYRSPPKDDAFVRVEWTPKGSLPTPIPLGALSHRMDSEMESAVRVRSGRALFIERRCANCHSLGGGAKDNPELALDAPSFDGIGSRRNARWMAEWILDPNAQRSSAQMPRLFHGPQAKENAEATAAFLASLKSDSGPAAASAPSKDQVESGQQLFAGLLCAACHVPPNAPGGEEERISLSQVQRKFQPGQLAAFLHRPEAHFAWTRMPNFKLSDDEAVQLAAYLGAHAEKAESASELSDPRLVERGRALVQSTGCLNCHALKMQNQFPGKPWRDLAAERRDQACLAPAATDNLKAPFFGLSQPEIENLKAFAAAGPDSLTRFAPTEFAARQLRNLKCQECHGKFEGFPPVEILGGKLNPEWTQTFIAGRVTYKPRPWLPARMPAFPAMAEALGQGMAMLHGYPPKTSREPAIVPESARVGQKLVSADGGFSCVACHAVGKVGASLVFDSAGINLAYSAERLRKSYFTRWLFNPLSIDPSSKMPMYFDESGRSPLSDVYDGDGSKQIDAIWQYLRLGEKMPPPGNESSP